MLGWEFPPIISGGLGVACKGIADALSKKVDLNLILPSAKGTINKGYRILGTDSYIQFKNNYKTYIDGAKRQAYRSKNEFSQDKMKEKIDSIFTQYIPEFPKEIKLQLPQLKKLELPKLKKVEENA